MKEIKLYLNFLKKHYLILVFFTLVSAISGYVYVTLQPVSYNSTAVYEFNFQTNEVSSKKILAEEAVKILRTDALRTQLQIGSELTAFNAGPISVQVEISSNDLNQSKAEINRINNYLLQKYDLSTIGSPNLITDQKNPLFWAIFGGLLGFLLGLSVVITREYFNKF
jgi:hypothetical protein